MSRRRLLRMSAAGCGVAGAMALGYVPSVVLDARLYLAAAPAHLARPHPTASAGATPRLGEGAALAEIEIARVGLRAIVAQGDSPAVLRRAVDHLGDSAMPGTGGHVVLAGHRATVFRLFQASTAESTLTLVTCHPFVSIGSAPNRFVVRARAANDVESPALVGGPT